MVLAFLEESSISMNANTKKKGEKGGKNPKKIRKKKWLAILF